MSTKDHVHMVPHFCRPVAFLSSASILHLPEMRGAWVAAAQTRIGSEVGLQTSWTPMHSLRLAFAARQASARLATRHPSVSLSARSAARLFAVAPARQWC
jgi:hypothetical protein